VFTLKEKGAPAASVTLSALANDGADGALPTLISKSWKSGRAPTPLLASRMRK
jgi:hypothetical protein